MLYVHIYKIVLLPPKILFHYTKLWNPDEKARWQKIANSRYPLCCRNASALKELCKHLGNHSRSWKAYKEKEVFKDIKGRLVSGSGWKSLGSVGNPTQSPSWLAWNKRNMQEKIWQHFSAQCFLCKSLICLLKDYVWNWKYTSGWVTDHRARGEKKKGCRWVVSISLAELRKMFFSPLLSYLPPFHFLHYVCSSRLRRWSWMLMRPSAGCPQTELFKVISPGSRLLDLFVSLHQLW